MKIFFTQALRVKPEEAGCEQYVNEEKSRGRHEIREVWITSPVGLVAAER